MSVNLFRGFFRRVRFGYAHVVNNLYQGWGLYAIGGSMNPSIKSQANLFIAPKGEKKEVIVRNITLTRASSFSLKIKEK